MKNKDYENRMRRLNIKRQCSAKMRSLISGGKSFEGAMAEVEAGLFAAAKENKDDAGQIHLAWTEYKKALKQVAEANSNATK